MKITIHQVYYDDSQRRALDPAFVPYDNRANPDPIWREHHVFRSEYLAGNVREGEATGYLSWKFGMKTRVHGRDFVEFIERNPGRDAWFLNPYGIEPRRFRNVWLQGEHHHPGILHLARRVFRHVGIECDPESLEQLESQVLYCNYWVGTRRFWDAYMTLCEQVRDCLLHTLDEDDRRLLYSRADRTIDACYIPFIMERLFSTLLAVRGDLSCAGWDGEGARRPRRKWLRLPRAV